jgi:6-phosphofructokinase 1
MSRRIGILTGGGDAPGLNTVIRAVTKTAILRHGLVVIGIEDGYEGLLTRPLRCRRLSLDGVRGILPRGGSILGCSNRTDPTAHNCRWEPPTPEVPNAYDVAVEGIRQLGLAALIVLGGDGTLSMAGRMAERGAPIIGVPKTIDNDVAATDVTFGFDTALTTATEAIDRLHSTAEAHHRIMIVEVMGRQAGWIALAAGLAGGADVILMPEIPVTLEAVLGKVEERYSQGRNFTIIVVAEGARPVGGEAIYQATAAGQSRRLGGIGLWLESALATRTRRDVRATVLGHLQRGGGPTPADRVLATRFGSLATELAARGETGVMVALRGRAIVPVPLAEAARAPRQIEPTGELVGVARGLGISFGDGTA